MNAGQGQLIRISPLSWYALTDIVWRTLTANERPLRQLTATFGGCGFFLAYKRLLFVSKGTVHGHSVGALRVFQWAENEFFLWTMSKISATETSQCYWLRWTQKCSGIFNFSISTHCSSLLWQQSWKWSDRRPSTTEKIMIPVLEIVSSFWSEAFRIPLTVPVVAAAEKVLVCLWRLWFSSFDWHQLSTRTRSSNDSTSLESCSEPDVSLESSQFVHSGDFEDLELSELGESLVNSQSSEYSSSYNSVFLHCLNIALVVAEGFPYLFTKSATCLSKPQSFYRFACPGFLVRFWWLSRGGPRCSRGHRKGEWLTVRFYWQYFHQSAPHEMSS